MSPDRCCTESLVDRCVHVALPSRFLLNRLPAEGKLIARAKKTSAIDKIGVHLCLCLAKPVNVATDRNAGTAPDTIICRPSLGLKPAAHGSGPPAAGGHRSAWRIFAQHRYRERLFFAAAFFGGGFGLCRLARTR